MNNCFNTSAFRLIGTVYYLLLIGLVMGICPVSRAQTEDSECMFEFNKAFALNESGMQHLEAAQEMVEKNDFRHASERYVLAGDLLQQSYDAYQTLSSRIYDCSPTNLSIAKNNARLALENLGWAKSSLDGLECLKAINELEALSNFASEYYYDHNDPESAKNTIADALTLSEQIRRDNICRGDYSDLLLEQHRFAQNIASSLENRGRFDRCIEFVKTAATLEKKAHQASQAKDKAGSRTRWQEILRKTTEGINAKTCDGLYLKRLETLRTFAERQLAE